MSVQQQGKPEDRPSNPVVVIQGDELQRMYLSLELYKPPEHVRQAILNAYNSPVWNWKNSDGCTGVSELHFPKGYRFPPCVMHDHQCWLVRQGKQKAHIAHGLFYEANRSYGVSVVRSTARWIGVTVAWPFIRLLGGKDECKI